MKTFKQALEVYLKSLNEEHTIYVLKGFNYWLDDLDTDLFLGGKTVNSYMNLKESIQGLSSMTRAMFLLYENLLYLYDQNALGSIEFFTQYKFIIIENDYFDSYYPGFRTDLETIKNDFESEEDNIIQKFYCDIQKIDNTLFMNFNEIPDKEFKTIKLTEVGINFEVDNNLEIELYSNINHLALQGIIFEILNFGKGKILCEKEGEYGKSIGIIRKKFETINIFITVKDDFNKHDVEESDYKEYLEILQRKNPSYNFLDIQIYHAPDENTETKEISQAVIIDRIVKNCMKAQKEEQFRDIFVTAPTGAGKSVMFQIPAIYLAEKSDLVTIVISPLIGLMNDQVNNIQSMTKLAETINSDYTPSQKENVLEQIKNGDKSILYLSPETLLSNTDITNLIGDRKIGLLVVDEAHIVSTWGKSFRPDYWYLGEFISRLRKSEKSNQNFPIATFTATATYGSEDNMYFDIIESLKMTAETFLGRVRRDDIDFEITNKTKEINYQDEKLLVAIDSINKLQKTGEKTLVYVPYRRHIDDIYSRLENQEKIGKYSGEMFSGEKNETLEKIVNGEKNVVLATKAFGMGIDINDIKYVYHFAPTGNISDYLQEIGRAARERGMNGVALTDFFKEDFRYINQLFGMSAIKHWQVIAVLSKINELYKKHKKRNFLVSPMEFSHIFANESDTSRIDAQLKTALLIIKKDFELLNSSNYIPLIFKPRSIFTNAYFMIKDGFVDKLVSSDNFKYFRKIQMPRNHTYETYTNPVKVEYDGETYVLDFKKMWEEKYKDLSFASFKYSFYNNELSNFDFRVNEELIPKTIIEIKFDKINFDDAIVEMSNILNALKDIFDDIRQSRKHFTVRELANKLRERLSFKNTYTPDLLAQSMIYILNNIDTGHHVSKNFATYNSQTDKWNIQTASYETRIKKIIRQARLSLTGNINAIQISVKNRNSNKDIRVLLAQIIEILELAEVNIRTGDNPEFFVRVNNSNAIEKIINDKFYKSKTVELVKEKHDNSTRIMEYFFTQLSTKKDRWDFIEQYFLGHLDTTDIKQLKDVQRESKKESVSIANKVKFPYSNWEEASSISPDEFYIINEIPIPTYFSGEFTLNNETYPFSYVWEDRKIIVYNPEETEKSIKNTNSEWKIISEQDLKLSDFM